MPDNPQPPIVMPEIPGNGELEIDPSGPSPLPIPSPNSSWNGPPTIGPLDESANYGLGTWLAFGAFAALGAVVYRNRDSIRKVFR